MVSLAFGKTAHPLRWALTLPGGRGADGGGGSPRPPVLMSPPRPTPPAPYHSSITFSPKDVAHS